MKGKPGGKPARGGKPGAGGSKLRPPAGGCVPPGGVTGRGSVPEGGAPDPDCFPLRRPAKKRR